MPRLSRFFKCFKIRKRSERDSAHTSSHLQAESALSEYEAARREELEQNLRRYEEERRRELERNIMSYEEQQRNHVDSKLASYEQTKRRTLESELVKLQREIDHHRSSAERRKSPYNADSSVHSSSVDEDEDKDTFDTIVRRPVDKPRANGKVRRPTPYPEDYLQKKASRKGTK